MDTNHYRNKIMAFFAIAAAVAGTGLSMYGQHQAAKAQADMLQQQNDWTNQTQKLQAEWNRDQLAKQAKYDETTAQKNMRRERENNKRELARRRAVNARGGLMETGAVQKFGRPPRGYLEREANRLLQAMQREE